MFLLIVNALMIVENWSIAKRLRKTFANNRVSSFSLSPEEKWFQCLSSTFVRPKSINYFKKKIQRFNLFYINT